MIWTLVAQAWACFALVDVRVHAPDGPHDDWDVVVDQGRVRAVGANLDTSACAVRTGKGWQVTAGFVAVGTQVGLNEVDLEQASRDDAPTAADPVRAAFHVADAFNPRSVVVPVTRLGGVTTVGVTPTGGFISGVSAAFALDGGMWVDSLVNPGVGLEVHLNALGSSAAGLLRLRELLDEARYWTTRPDAFQSADALSASRLDLQVITKVATGALPVWVHADRASDIEAVLRFATNEKVRVVIVGGAEAWLVAPSLAASRTPVVLDPRVYGPGSFDQTFGAAENGARLRAAGVEVAFSGFDTHQARGLRYLAGDAVRSGMKHADALAAITSVPAALLGATDRGRIAPGAVADLAVWTGDPLDIPARLALLLMSGESVPLTSRQTELVDRWRDVGPVLP